MDKLILSRTARETTAVYEIAQRVDSALDAISDSTYVAIRPTHFAEENSEAAEEYMQSNFFALLSPAEKSLAYRALMLSEDSKWSFGEEPLPFVDLFNESGAVTTHRVAVSDLGRLVLSGAIGADFLRVDPELADIAPDHLGSLDRSIYVGGVVASSLSAAEEKFISSFNCHTSTDDSGATYVTTVGADAHGDFRTSRQLIPDYSAIDPLGRRWPFSDETSRKEVGAYHSVEPNVLSALLRYQFGYEHQSPQAMYDRLAERLAETASSGSGMIFFADYGESDGSYQYGMIREMLTTGRDRQVNPGEYLTSSVVVPGNEDSYRMTLQATELGVRFMNHSDSKVDSEFIVPSAEIDDYIITLMSSAYGRTSPGALRVVLEALRGERLIKF